MHYLKIDGISGSSTNRQFPQWIELMSGPSGNSGRGAGFGFPGGGSQKQDTTSMNFVLRLDGTAAILANASSTGKTFKQAIYAYTPDDPKNPGAMAFRLTMDDVAVASFQVSGIRDSRGPVANLSLGFTSLRFGH